MQTNQNNNPSDLSADIAPKQSPNISHYINAESSLIEFNKRVLHAAKNTKLPLLERLKYLCISSSNLDEFFEVKMARLYEMQIYPAVRTKPDGITPKNAIAQLSEQVHKIVKDQYSTLNHILMPALEKEGIRFLRRNHWTDEHKMGKKLFY